jgi:hypothetical protein
VTTEFVVIPVPRHLFESEAGDGLSSRLKALAAREAARLGLALTHDRPRVITTGHVRTADSFDTIDLDAESLVLYRFTAERVG